MHALYGISVFAAISRFGSESLRYLVGQVGLTSNAVAGLDAAKKHAGKIYFILLTAGLKYGDRVSSGLVLKI
jgi:uncharacterized RmlC-like cupin family protein